MDEQNLYFEIDRIAKQLWPDCRLTRCFILAKKDGLIRIVFNGSDWEYSLDISKADLLLMSDEQITRRLLA